MSTSPRLRKSRSKGDHPAAESQTAETRSHLIHSGMTTRSSSGKKRMRPTPPPMEDDDDDQTTELSTLTNDSTTTSSSGKNKQVRTPPSHTVLHASLGENVELTHNYQDQQTLQKQVLPDATDDGPTVRDEMPNMLLLVALYTLQGVPLGLCLGSVPFLLQQSVSYTALGLFTFSSWPYSLKLLWSPLVDCWYSNALGRRKSWIVPIQFIIGFMLVGVSYFVEDWIKTGAITPMTIVFFILIMFVATQDIAVDGWAITLLSKKNVGYASTCQSIGQNIGFFASYTIFLALNHAEFCNKFRSEPSAEGFVTLSGYIFFWGISFCICTLYLLFFKHEPAYVPEEGEDMGLRSIYGKMWRIVQLRPVRDLIVIMVTCRVAFAAGDNITALKLIEKGFPKESMAMLVVVLFPFELVCPILVGRWSSRGNPLSPWITGYPFRLGVTLLGVLLVYTFPEGELSYWFYARVLCVQLVYSLASNVLFVSQCAFYAQFFVFAAVDIFTCKKLTDATGRHDEPCYGILPRGTDGFYIISFICFLIGTLWYFTFRRRVLQLGATNKKYWSCS